MILLFSFIFYLTLNRVTSALEDSECDKNGILIYEDLGCTAEYGNEKQCPKKYSCKGLEPSTENCYFRGKIYKDKEQVDNSLANPSCDQSCFCSVQDGRASFTCAILDCAEWLGAPVSPGCYRKYSLEHCCSVGQTCPPFGDMETCLVEGKEYREGEKFYPSNTCLSCVCQKGFKGKFEEPFCKRRLCGKQLKRSAVNIQASCAPFYSKDLHKQVLCCPDDWICADGSETFQGEAKSEETCKFGTQSLKVGQYFEKLNVKDGFGRSFEKVKCECAVPPLARCVNV